MYIFKKNVMFIYDINYMNKYMQIFSKYMLYVCVFIYT